MKTLNNIKAVSIALLLFASIGVNAQQEATDYLNREMTLEREYDPSVQDANKVNTLPEIKEPEIRKIPIDYATIALPAFPPKEISFLPSGKIMTDMKYSKQRGYFNLAGGTYMNINGDLGYHILSTDKDELSIFFSHRSTNGKIKYIDFDEKIKAKINDNLGGLTYRHHFPKATFRAGAQYGYSAFNYYGLATGNYDPLSSTLPSDPIVSHEEADRKTNQVGQTIKAYLGVSSKEKSPIGYLLNVGYTNFSYKYGIADYTDGPTENQVDLKLNVNIPSITDQWFGVDADIKYFNYSLPNGMPRPEGGYFNYFYENYAEFTLSPYYKIEGGSWNLCLGANAMFYTGDSKLFRVSPNVTFDIEVASKTVFYAEALGKLQSNSMYNLFREFRYVNPSEEVVPSIDVLDATVGIKSAVLPGFWFDIFGGYKITKDDFFLLPQRMFAENEFGSMLSPMSSIDTKLFFAGANLKYNYQKLFEIQLKGVFNSWDASLGRNWVGGSGDLDHAYGRPKMEFNVGIKANPIDRLSVALDYYLATDRYTRLHGATDIKLKNINELNLTASYKLNDTFGVYLKLNNLLFQKYELHYFYPMQGFNVMGGININF